MATKQFKIKIFDSADPQSQYDAIATPDPQTMYILTNGRIYYGTILMAGDGAGVQILKEAGAIPAYSAGKLYAVCVSGIKINGEREDAELGLYFADSTSHLSPLRGEDFLTRMASYIADGNKVIQSTNAGLDKDFAGDETKFMTSKAVVAYVKAVLGDYVTYKFSDDSNGG